MSKNFHLTAQTALAGLVCSGLLLTNCTSKQDNLAVAPVQIVDQSVTPP